MNYAENRDSEQLRHLNARIDTFLAQRNPQLVAGSACARQTVFFFPGGMASQLHRATQPFQEGVAAAQQFNYEIVWIDIEKTPFGGASDLAMHWSGGIFRDKDDRIIIADGSVNLEDCTPHDVFAQWCASNNADLFVFNWDWRRRLEETMRFFVDQFLPLFRQRVTAAGLPDPLARFALVGHSFGGMIANLVLRDNAPIVAGMTCAITVATPFYGYAGQAHRWFEGEPYLNLFGLYTRDVAKTVCTLPGLYTLMYLEEATFDHAVNHPLLTGGAFPVVGYPSMDAVVPANRADPYNPQPGAGVVRYPLNLGFDLAELDYARLQVQVLNGPMAPNLLQKFFNVRGVRNVADTAGNVACGWIGPGFNPPWNASPIVDMGKVAGDDTQPAWTARLATNDPARIITIQAADIQHAFMMNHWQVVAAIGNILCAAANQPPAAQPPEEEPASEKDVLDFLRWLHKHRKRIKWPPRKNTVPPDFLPPRFRDRFPAIMRRFYKDLVRGPVSREIGVPNKGKRRPPRRRKGRKPSRKR